MVKKKGKTAEQKLKEFLAKRESEMRCLHCSYYDKRDHYCNDLDVRVYDEPVCSNSNYYA